MFSQNKPIKQHDAKCQSPFRSLESENKPFSRVWVDPETPWRFLAKNLKIKPGLIWGVYTRARARTQTHTRAQTNTDTCTRVRTHTCMHTNTHTTTHTDAHTRTRTRALSLSLSWARTHTPTKRHIEAQMGANNTTTATSCGETRLVLPEPRHGAN